MSSSTKSIIREVLQDSEISHILNMSTSSAENPRSSRYLEISPISPARYDPGVSQFFSIITPLTEVLALGGSKNRGAVEFRMRRKNKTVTLQWEPFRGIVAANGIAFLVVSQTICNVPPYPISLPIFIVYKGVGRNTHAEINPNISAYNIVFYLNSDGSSTGISAGDDIYIPGSAISWVVD